MSPASGRPEKCERQTVYCHSTQELRILRRMAELLGDWREARELTVALRERAVNEERGEGCE